MRQKLSLVLLGFVLLSGPCLAIELGITGGKVIKSTGFNYGFSATSGFLIPMVKFEVEYFRMIDPDAQDKPSTISAGIKFRPKLGRISPYGVLGVGIEFEKLGFKFSEYNKFTFLGGGMHFKIKSMISLRADIRFLNLKDKTKIRLDLGIFIKI